MTDRMTDEQIEALCERLPYASSALAIMGEDQACVDVESALTAIRQLQQPWRGMESAAVEQECPRRRKPQSQRETWPAWPPIGEDRIEQLIDNLCGCAGKYDCDCVSVFNKTRSQAWWDYNTRATPPETER